MIIPFPEQAREHPPPRIRTPDDLASWPRENPSYISGMVGMANKVETLRAEAEADD